jgi:2-keto-3-deoxy-L-rhamnonate aldolase RhmA
LSDKLRQRFRKRLRNGEPVLGTFLFIPSADLAEAVARTGVDFAIIDMEHSPKSWQTVGEMVRAVQFGGAASLVRVASNDPVSVLHALEIGADGVVLPFIEDAADVRRAVAAARYAPVGSRGVCTMSRAAGYGIGRDGFEAIAERANDEVVIIGQIESAHAVDNINEIAQTTPGLDALILGRADLATSIGHVGQTGHADVVELSARVIDRLAELNSVAFGLAVYDASESEQWARRGASVFVHSADVSVLVRGYQDALAGFAVVASEPVSKK